MTTTSHQPGVESTGATIEHIDPATLLIEANVRSDVDLDADFVASVREHGVLTPVLVHRTEEGLRVRAGQRRTLAAVEAGLTAIPAYVVSGDDDEARRLIEQWTENHHRRALRAADDVAVFEQLALLGMTPGQIARRTRAKKGHVEAALQVARSERATAVTAKYDLTLDQAAILAEFDDDAEAVKALAVAAVKEPEQFAHVTQRLRDKRAEAQAVADLTAALTEAGTRVIERPPFDDKTTERLLDLATVVGDERVPLTPELHAECPGRAAWIYTTWKGAEPIHACIDPRGYGHVARHTYSSIGSERQSGPMTEEQKAERRALIANNKAWRSAETVRRDWLATFAARRTAPKEAAVFLAARLVANVTSLDKAYTQGRHRLARVLLGLPEHLGYSAPDPLVDMVATATPARAQHIALVLMLAAIEEGTGPHTWRNVCQQDRAYFTALAGWGYALSEVEALVTAPE